jgi:PAS domain S-box-containing protein/diguanylate cyclase (GGDEF)-like protein
MVLLRSDLKDEALIDFFLTNTKSANQVFHVGHHVELIVLSLMVAFISSWSAFYMAYANRQANSLTHRRVSLACASMVLGLGIWAMHFIGMLAMPLPQLIAYDLGLTALSILPGMLAAWLALHFMQTPNPSTARIVGGGALVGLGIAVMHYCGIAAMQMSGVLRLSFSAFVISAVAGLFFAVSAFAVQRILHQSKPALLSWRWRLLPPSLLTAAITSMHYISMQGLRLIPSAHTPSAANAAAGTSDALSWIIAGLTMVVLLISGLATAILRYRDLWQEVALRDARLNAMIETAKDGVITIDERGLVHDYNPAAEKVFGFTREEVLGRNISMLMPSPLAEQHDGHIQRHLGHPDEPISVNGREVLGKRKDGRLIPIQLAIGKAVTPGGTFFMGYLQDISERKRTDAQLRIAASVFQHVREGVAIVDANHNVSDVNPAFLRLMEKTREACIGRSLEELYEDADIPPEMSKLWRDVAANQYWQSEIMFTRGNGSMWVQRLSISSVLNELQRPQHFIAVVSDVSERPGLELMLPHADLHDSATGLPSKKLLLDRLSNSILTARRKSTQLGMVLIELRQSSTASSEHAEADMARAIKLMAQLLQQHLRSADTLARLSGHQLAMLLPDLKAEKAFETVLKRIQESLQAPALLRGNLSLYSVHLGWSSYPQHGITAAEMMEHAQSNLMMHTGLQNRPLSL